MSRESPPAGSDRIRRTTVITTELAQQGEEMVSATAETLARRGVLLAQAGPTLDPAAQHELQRIGTEKGKAALDAGWAWWEGITALHHQGWRVAITQWQLASALWSWDWTLYPAGLASAQQRLLTAWDESAAATLELLPLAAEMARREVRPYHRRVTANARRLAEQQAG